MDDFEVVLSNSYLEVWKNRHRDDGNKDKLGGYLRFKAHSPDREPTERPTKSALSDEHPVNG